MRKLLFISFTLLLLTSFTSCAVINALLGYEECYYTGCTNACVDNCNYCSTHCYRYNVPEDLNKKINQSIDRQLEQYRNDQKRSGKK
ncbi:MAG: hypothetical protein LBL79_00820 [Prevotella sp.]|nr:hypothetical protein [Prevotella sp.]